MTIMASEPFFTFYFSFYFIYFFLILEILPAVFAPYSIADLPAMHTIKPWALLAMTIMASESIFFFTFYFSFYVIYFFLIRVDKTGISLGR
jgi:hypothetical protein